MLILKRFLSLGVVFFAVSSVAMAQSSDRSRNTNQEMSVEQSYLQESIELMIIREQSRATSRDMKLVAIEYIDDAIDRGNRSDEIRQSLEYLGTEGVRNQSRESGRLINNFPDIRRKAAISLGNLGTPEAKDSLLLMLNSDNEPMVLMEAINSLAKIGINNNDETVEHISWVVNRFDTLNPDSLLAISALEAYEKLAETSNGISPSAINTIIKISEGRYERIIQDRARDLLTNLRKYNAQQNN